MEFPEVRCDSPPDASAEMGLISPGGENAQLKARIAELELREKNAWRALGSQADAGGKKRDPLEEIWNSTDYTQGLRPRHRRERNPERPPSNSHTDWPFLRPPKRVPEVPVVSREHLAQLEKIQEVLPSRRDEAHFR